MKKILITGSSGFIGNALTKKLKKEGNYVIGADIETPKYTHPDEFYHVDLRDYNSTEFVFQNKKKIDEVYNLACMMGGMGYIGNEEHSYDIMVGSTQIVTNIIDCSLKYGVKKHFYSSSACVYNMFNQGDFNNVIPLKEESAYPAMPDLVYGWQKLCSEMLYQSAIVKGLDVRIARFFNIFGEYGTWDGGKEKAPAALLRKAILADGVIDVWGTGEAQRSFLHISECLTGISKIMEATYQGVVNLGSEEVVTINQLAQMCINISGKKTKINNIKGNVGVASRATDNSKLEQITGWKPFKKLEEGLQSTYKWIENEIMSQRMLQQEDSTNNS